MYVRYFASAPLSLAFNLFVIVTCPIWAAWAAIANVEVLPKPFHLVHTHDNNIYGMRKPATTPHRWLMAMRWLCRNPGYGFDAYVLGFADAGSTIIQVTPDYHIMSDAARNLYFGWKKDVPLWGDRYIKLWFGWHHANQAGHHMLKFDINPFKRTSQ